jgi:hypothetical protein
MLSGSSILAGLWVTTTVAETLLLLRLAQKKLLRALPAFAVYVLIVIVDTTVLLVLFQISSVRWEAIVVVWWIFSWAMSLAMWLAVIGIVRRTLAPHGEIWWITKRWLMWITAAIVVFSSLLLLDDSHADRFILATTQNADIALAAVILALSLMARFCQVRIEPLEKRLAIGLFMTSSCSGVGYLSSRSDWLMRSGAWNLLPSLIFLAALLVWTRAVRKYRPKEDGGFTGQ